MKDSQKGVVLIIGLIFVFLTAVLVAGILLITDIENRNVVRDQWNLTAFHLAEAGAEDALWALKNLYTTAEWTTAGWTTGTTYTKNTFTSHFKDSTGTVIGDYEVTIYNPTSTTPTIESTGYSPSESASDNKERTVRIAISESEGTGNVKAAIQTNTDTTTIGTLEVDGRNHDLDNSRITPGGTGVLAIHTTGDYTLSGSSALGGTSISGTDYPNITIDTLMGSTHSDVGNVIGKFKTWTGGYPTTPDAVMDYPTGTLKAKAQSGTGGSQYVTSPSSLTTPLKGVTYVEMSGTWNAGSFNFTGTGVLIVHSTTGNTAQIKTLNTGRFKGLIIADNVEKIHNEILGAVITMSTSPAGNCIGNGNGWVHYSSQAISKSFWTAGDISLTWQER